MIFSGRFGGRFGNRSGERSGQQPGGGLRWTSAGATDQGRVRSINQDAFLDRTALGLWVVADGMGGHSDGAHASRAIIEALAALPHMPLLGRRVRAIVGALRRVNADLLAHAEATQADLTGSTVAVLVAVREHAAILWTGDSRVYRLRNDTLECLTTDHSQVQMLIDEGLLGPEEAENHPAANVLLRAVGSEEELKVDYRVERLLSGDRYLLCSDGLYRELTEDAIVRVVAATDPARSAPELVRQACEHGGRDNVTAVVVAI
jgi:serine/threonine protein phosphatase PrpC